MKFAVDVGMIVRCCREYESISVGCEGKVIKIMKDGGLHDLNVKVFIENNKTYILAINVHSWIVSFIAISFSSDT